VIVFLAEVSTSCVVAEHLNGPMLINGAGALIGGTIAAFLSQEPHGLRKALLKRLETTYLAVFTSFP